MDLNKLPSRVADKIEITESCWLWNGAKDRHGYGRISKKSYGEQSVHRLVFACLVSEPRQSLDHLCRTPSCCNPFHLEDISHRENVRRGEAGKYQRDKWALPRKCANGHMMTKDTVYEHYSKKLKRLNRQCRTCRHESRKRRRAAGALN